MTKEARKRYPSDLTDEQWELIETLIPQQRRTKKGGRPRAVNMREVINTILYQARSGCQWDMLPHDLLPKSTVYDYFARWRDDGTWQRINDGLVGAIRQLESPSEEIQPSAASIDSQTAKSSERCDDRGYDGGKKIASSAESVGSFRLRELSELMIQGDFDRIIRFETVGLFHCQLGLRVHALHTAVGYLPTRPEPV